MVAELQTVLTYMKIRGLLIILGIDGIYHNQSLDHK